MDAINDGNKTDLAPKNAADFTDFESRRDILAEVLTKNYISICDVDLYTGKATVLKSTMDQELEGCSLPWDKLMERYANRRAFPLDQDTVRALTLDKLEALLERGKGSLSIEVRCKAANEAFDWIEMSISIVSSKNKRLLATTRNINEDRMLKSIVNMFVYQNLDYFVLLDAKHNSYTMFSGNKNNTALPPVVGDDYTTQLYEYNKRYVLPEDYERVTANMQIPRVLEMLEKADKYSFQSSGVTDSGQYRRTQVQFQYYDKSAQLILLTRIDITQAFRDEQARNEELSIALKEAQHDALTGIYNQKATSGLVSSLLERQCRSGAAIMFIDVDNFKMVNDTLGHQEGDKLLRFMAGALRELAGRSGIAGRVGGDEFLLFLPDVSTTKDIKQRAASVCNIFDSYQDPAVKALPLSCSVGISVYPNDGTAYDVLIRKADQALYTAKRYGKKRYHFYSAEPFTCG